MSEPWIDTILFWLIEVPILSALLLGTALLACLAIRQAARRMTIARAGAMGLAMLAVLTAFRPAAAEDKRSEQKEKLAVADGRAVLT